MPTKTINLVLGTHNHQPVGNFDSVFSHAVEHSYRPFLDTLEQFPKIKIAQHYSGALLDWLRAKKPELLRHIGRLVKSGQVEMMGGAYFEAILSVIPDSDKTSQLDLLNKTIKRLFGAKPVGMWLAERVWEQHLTRFIADAGIQYIVVDDTHFKYAGFSDDELHGYYRTEEQGKTVAIFPISKMLRYTVPFQPVEKTIEYLRSIATEDGNRIVVFADDGEKFGVWPKTYDHVYKDKWLEHFFQALTDNSDWIKIHHFRDILGKIPPVGRTYLPNASYAEMMHWALPASHVRLYEEFELFLEKSGVLEKYESFSKGGFWRNFLVKYDETNTMHKKMMRVSDRAHRIAGSGKAKVPMATWQKIWSSQCNDPYWHGVFGGLYLPVLRYPVYHNLISAERDLDRIEGKKNVTIQITDHDCDGRDEILIETPVMNWYFAPDRGGSLFELDFKPISLNLLDIISRREEGYHHKLAEATDGTKREGVSSIHDIVLVKEPGLESHLNYDWYRHGSLIDHFFGASVTLEDVWKCRYHEEGDFVNKPYEVAVRKRGRSVRLTMRRTGAIWRNEKPHRVRIEKSCEFNPNSTEMTIDYTVRNLESEPIDVWFGTEFCAGLQAGHAHDRYYFSRSGRLEDSFLDSKGELPNESLIGLRDEWLGVEVRIETETPASFWRFPLETISLSESGFERIYQGSVLIPTWKMTLTKEWKCRVKQSVTQLNQGRKKR